MSALQPVGAEVVALAGAVERRFGLRLLPVRHRPLAEAAQALVEAGQVASLAEVRARLEGAGEGDPVVARMRQAVSIGETYFWRAPEQLLALRRWVLGHVVAARRARGGRLLRVWSAGCATGEEAYTLAWLFKGAAPDFTVQVVGTDMNEASLAVARRGRYRARSLRGEARRAMAGALETEGEEWVVGPELRRMVTFLPFNLVTDTLPDAERGLSGFDVVVCRNVIIYLDPQRLPRVGAGLAAAASPRSVLALSPAEYRTGAHLPGFTDVGGALFVRGAEAGQLHAQSARATRTSPQASTVLSLSPPSPSPHRGEGRGEGGHPASPSLPPSSPAPTSLLAEARAAADRGELAQALALALAAEEHLPLSPLPACLRGLVRQAQGDEEGAAAEFRRALACEEGFVAAQLSLGQALVRLGRQDEARRWLLRALVQLESMPPQAEVPGLDVPAEVARRLAHEALLREEHA